jgi:16S rRNA (guanine966-N2)-methyltransferase
VRGGVASTAVRIVAGSRKGHRISAPKGVVTRPTGDRVREAAFSLIGPLEDATVLDLFAGSGAMGLEALSRGASRCVFVERDRAACRVITQNLEKLRLTGALVLCRDVAGVLREERARGRRYDLVLVDAPYEDWARYEGDLGELIPAVLAEDGLAVVETSERTEPELPLDLVTTRRYGSARITVFAR